VMGADGSDQRRVTDNEGGDYSASFSPDGARIAFQSNRGRSSDIFTTTADGDGVTRVTRDATGEFVPHWQTTLSGAPG
jgi:TolB protein